MKTLVLISLLFLCTLFEIFSQSNDIGIYLLREDIDNCTKSVIDKITKTQYCSGNAPVIANTAFIKISEIYYGKKSSFFEIELSPKGQEQLNAIITSNASIHLGFVQNVTLIGLIDITNVDDYQRIKIMASSAGNSLSQIRNTLINTIE